MAYKLLQSLLLDEIVYFYLLATRIGHLGFGYPAMIYQADLLLYTDLHQVVLGV